MSNSSWFSTTNKVLELAGQLQITSAVNFNAPITGLTRVQSQARAFIEMCNRELNLRRNNRDTVQEFQIITKVGVPANPGPNNYYYTLDMSVSMASLRFESFFNATAQGTGSSAFAQPLYNIEYREFRQSYPDFTQINTGAPQNWIILPKSLVAPTGAGTAAETIMFFPIPDKVYNIVYQAKTDVAPLTVDTSLILWPIQYEHILWKYGVMYLEAALGEGKEQGAIYFADKALGEYNFWSAGPQEERRAVRTGMKLRGLTRGRRVNFYSDTPSA